VFEIADLAVEKANFKQGASFVIKGLQGKKSKTAALWIGVFEK